MSDNHQVYYNDKVVDMGYIPDIKKQFNFACMRVHDNGAKEGIVLTPKNELFRVTQGKRTAVRIKDNADIEALMQLFIVR